MEHLDGRIVLSASDLTNHLACTRLTALEHGALGGGTARPAPDAADADVIRRRGEGHEALYLKQLRNEGRQVVELDRPDLGAAGLIAGEASTVAAMAAGAEVIYQGTFFDGSWRGHPDFLFRVEKPSAGRAWSYEVCDTKLARRVKAAAILQTCSYSDHVERIQGSPPEQIHVVGGDFTTRTYRLADYAAYYRRTKAGLEAIVAAVPDDTYAWSVEHCKVCPWEEVCDTKRRSEDHLSLVANIRHNQARRLIAAGIGTVIALADPARRVPIPQLQTPVVDRLHAQAALQLEQRRTGQVSYELIDPVDDGAGLSLLPPSSPGDVFFDMEGDPYVADDGLEYLFGATIIDGDGKPVFQPIWAHDTTAEKQAFEAFVDFVVARQRAWPDLHVYHYAAYEVTALKRLMGAHATRESEIDALLRGGVFVDLYTVVRQGVRVSQESYGLKKLEPLYMATRDGAIASASASITAYEQWLLEHDQTILDEIADYNRLDCESTWLLREWLEARRIETEAASGIALGRPEPRQSEAPEALAQAEATTAALVARLTVGIPDDPAERNPAEQATWLLAQLLDWHRREARPEWWAHYARLAMSPDELLDDADALGGLQYEGVVDTVKQSLVHRYRFPSDQEHKIGVGATVLDPVTGKGAGTVQHIDNTAGTIDLKRSGRSTAPHPAAITPGTPRNDDVLRAALAQVGKWIAEHGIDAGGPYRAVRDLLLKTNPRLAGVAAGALLVGPGESPADALRRLALALDASCLPVQGPPGTGKTWSGARAIVDLVKAGKRVGICATSHKAIGNLLDGVCAAAQWAGVPLRTIQKADEDNRCTSPAAECFDDNAIVEARVAAGTVDVVAGTPWLFARPALTGTSDVLVVDEAGQMSLANLVAVGGAATNIILLGDPQQLPQPTKGTHPAGAGRSALEHILDGHPTMPAERGILLDVTYRMHPDVCRFVSDAFYESRLHSAASCEGQRVAAGAWAGGTGLRWIPVEHYGNKVSSPEEAAEVATGFNALLGRSWVNECGRRRRLGLDDILVVAPCNAHVAKLKAVLPAGARVGTVDKFQGQQAAVVIFSMATSSADDMPRNLEFLFSLNRLNVAISRARALAVLVCSPELLRVRCRTAQQMRLVNALCLFVEHAQRQSPVSKPEVRPAA